MYPNHRALSISKLDPIEFLQQLFPISSGDPRSADVIQFKSVHRKHGFRDELKCWTKADLHAMDRHNASELSLDFANADVYFSPHILTNTGPSVTDQEAQELGELVWIECDSLDILFGSNTPPKPSYMVQTAPQKFHAFWPLQSPLPMTDLMQITCTLVERAGLNVDESDLTRLEWPRLHGGNNHKCTPSYPVTLVRASNIAYQKKDFGRLVAPKLASSRPVVNQDSKAS